VTSWTLERIAGIFGTSKGVGNRFGTKPAAFALRFTAATATTRRTAQASFDKRGGYDRTSSFETGVVSSAQARRFFPANQGSLSAGHLELVKIDVVGVASIEVER